MSSPGKCPSSPPKSPLRGVDPRDLFLVKRAGRKMQERRGVAPLKLQRTGYKSPPAMLSPASPGRSVECGGYKRTDCELHEQASDYVHSIIKRKRAEDHKEGGIRSEALARMHEEDKESEEDELDQFPHPPGRPRPSSWTSIELRSIIEALEGIIDREGGSSEQIPDEEVIGRCAKMRCSAEHETRISQIQDVIQEARASFAVEAGDEMDKEMLKHVLRQAEDEFGSLIIAAEEEPTRIRSIGEVTDEVPSPEYMSSIVGHSRQSPTVPATGLSRVLSRRTRQNLDVALSESEDSVLPSEKTFELDERRRRWKERKAEFKQWLETGYIPDKYYERVGMLPPSQGGQYIDRSI